LWRKKSESDRNGYLCVRLFSRPTEALRRARSGVGHLIKIGWLTHSVGILDIGLDFKAG
jgi:hypothetical protein